MASNELKTAIFEDGTHAVLRADSANPRRLEVIATFYNAQRAQDYVRFQSGPSEEPQEERQPRAKPAPTAKPGQRSAAKHRQASKAKPKLSAAQAKPAVEAKPELAAEAQAKPAPEAKRENAAIEVSERQAAVLKGLRSLMDKKHRVEAKAAELAKASSIPLGSLHSILVALEKKHMIRTERQGSPKFPAIYEVLETSPKSTRSLNGAVHGKEANAQAAR
jgi:hypothetical protein